MGITEDKGKKIEWRSEDFVQDNIILVGDIGGTNTNLAVLGEKKGKFTMIVEAHWKSCDVDGVMTPIKDLIEIVAQKDTKLAPSMICISAAGPVANNSCKLTNLTWEIDGDKIAKETGIKTTIINDFLAISYAIPILELENPARVMKIPHCDGTIPQPKEGVKLVIGPGTGLGVGYLVPVGNGKYLPFSSEGGHSDFAAFDAMTWDLKHYMFSKLDIKPGVEPFVSGQGLINIYKFLMDEKKITMDDVINEIEAVDDADKPALISKYSFVNEDCRMIMTTFVKMLGNFAGSLSAIMLPYGGVFIAGGISSKNEEMFLRDNLFMKHFESNYKSVISDILKQIPVYIIRDYSISLYGAANAAMNIMK
jgi:glucokinase